jgi:hypothetical protein
MTENVAEVVDVGSEEEEESKSKGDNLASLLLLNRAPPKEVSWLPPDLRFSQPPGEIGSAPATTDHLPSELYLSSLSLSHLPSLKKKANWGDVLVLSLGSNKISSLPSFKHLSNLKVLVLDHNLIEAINSTTLPKTLEKLTLHDNTQLFSLPSNFSFCCPLLSSLRLDRCALLPSLPPLPSTLESLHLEDCFGLVKLTKQQEYEGSNKEAVDMRQASLALTLIDQLTCLVDLQLPLGKDQIVNDSIFCTVSDQIRKKYLLAEDSSEEKSEECTTAEEITEGGVIHCKFLTSANS